MKRRLFPTAIAVFAVALAGCAPAAAPPVSAPPAPTAAELRVDSLMTEYDRPGSPGAAVLVFRGDETLFSRGWGMANLEYDVPITPSTVFHVASVSKQFTAMALTMLAAEGRLSLDDDVRDHITELGDFGPRITLRHMLTHTSGLRDQWNLWVLAGGRMDDVIRQEDLFQLVTRQRELNFAPGSEYLYSNSGYMLAAKVVERVTGEPFGDWLRANVLAPLGMQSTQVYDDHERLVPGRAYSYRSDGDDGYRKAVLSYANSGATSLFTTTADLARWLRNFGHGRVGGAGVSGKMLQRGILTTGDTIAYALGVFVDEHRDLEMIQHGGADAGYRSFVAYYPELDAGVVVLSNLASFDPGDTARRIAEIYFEDAMKPAGSTTSSERADRGVAVDPALLERYTGEWRLDDVGSELVVTRRGARLFVTVPGLGRTAMEARSDSTFRVPDAGAEITFHLEDGEEEVQRASVSFADGRRAQLRRVEPFSPRPEELREFTGRYYGPELETLYTVVVEDDRLVARHRRHGDIVLTPERTDTFTGDQWFFGSLAFERGDAGEVTGFRVSSGRVLDLRFERLD